jgi:uncharacterized linocin/CFP29 family protein
MDHLFRDLAPISDAAWAEVNAEATRTLSHFLGARKLVDYTSGGWETSARPVGRITAVAGGDGVELASRRVQPLTEVRVPFTLSRAELDAVDRGASDMDTEPVIAAAGTAALTEDRAVFGGSAAAGIQGLVEATPHDVVHAASVEQVPVAVTRALGMLNEAGVAGPYALALGKQDWARVMESAEQGGYPLLKHLRLLVDGPVVWSPGLDGAVLLSQRGGDFEIVGGQDWAIGYRSHDADSVTLYLEESFTFVVNTPEAAVALGLGA